MMIRILRFFLSKRKPLFVLLFLLSVFLSCNFPRPGIPAPSIEFNPPGQGQLPDVSDWQRTVNKLIELQDELVIPDHLLELGAVKSERDFNPNEYFSVLKHVTVESGYELDYVYRYDLMGGMPLLYTRKAEKKPYRTTEDYAKDFPDAPQDDFLARIQSDGSAKGYFEFILLKIMAGQFYLWWHANYNDAQVVVDRDTLETLLASRNRYGEELPLDVRQQAGSLDPKPVVVIQAETVQVSVLVFTNWGGFIRKSFTLSREFPHLILKEREEVLVPFQSSVIY